MNRGKRRLQPETKFIIAFCLCVLTDGIINGRIHDFWFWGIVGLAAGVICHELGHVTFAVIGSIPLHRIVIGAGPLLYRRRFGKTWLEVRAWPLSGRIVPYPVMNYRWYWWALFLLGGVIGNLTVIGLLFGWQVIVAPGNAGDILGPVLFTQVFLVVMNIVPLPTRPVPTDGRQLLELLWRPAWKAAYDKHVSGYHDGNAPLAMSAAATRLLFHSFRLLVDEDARPAAREGMMRELHGDGLTREERMWALDALVSDGIVYGDPASRLHLDAWSQQALELGRDRPTLQGSRGAVLVELGRYAEGKALLAPLAAPEQADTFDSFMSRAFLALAEHGLGNDGAARQCADLARANAEFVGNAQTYVGAMLARLDRVIAPGAPGPHAGAAAPVGQFAQ
jgi:hypothetical protein